MFGWVHASIEDHIRCKERYLLDNPERRELDYYQVYFGIDVAEPYLETQLISRQIVVTVGRTSVTSLKT